MDVKEYIESGAIESCVFGLASDDESALFHQMYSQYPEVREAANAFEIALENTALLHAVEPEKSTKSKLFEAIKADSIPSIDPAGESKPNFSKHQIRNISIRFQYFAAASIILLLVSASFNLYFYTRLSTVNAKYIALESAKDGLLADNKVIQARNSDLYNNLMLMSDPSVLKVRMSGISGKENNQATVFWDKKTKDVYLLVNNLEQANPDHQFQLWAIVNGKPVDAGLIENCNGLCKLKNIPEAQAFAITLEKRGGSATPTLSQMYVLGKV